MSGMVTVEQIAKRLNVSRRTIIRWRHDGFPPPVIQHRPTVQPADLFSWTEIEEWVNAHDLYDSMVGVSTRRSYVRDRQSGFGLLLSKDLADEFDVNRRTVNAWVRLYGCPGPERRGPTCWLWTEEEWKPPDYGCKTEGSTVPLVKETGPKKQRTKAKKTRVTHEQMAGAFAFAVATVVGVGLVVHEYILNSHATPDRQNWGAIGAIVIIVTLLFAIDQLEWIAKRLAARVFARNKRSRW